MLFIKLKKPIGDIHLASFASELCYFYSHKVFNGTYKIYNKTIAERPTGNGGGNRFNFYPVQYSPRQLCANDTRAKGRYRLGKSY